ncbi:MAG: hypothetical protein QW503_05265 [Sulfolobales archaeon]
MRIRVIVVAKTYPELSKKYGPIVCTAGLTEDALEWVRLYPIPYRIFLRDKGFSKWDVIEVEVIKPSRDPRKESLKVVDSNNIKVLRHIDSWGERLRIITKVLDKDVESVVSSGRSLGVIKPRVVEDFKIKPRERLRDEAELEVLKKMYEAQATLLEYINRDELRSEILSDVFEDDVSIEPIPWIGYKFYCGNPRCRGHEMMVIDWEYQELFRKYRSEAPVRSKVYEEFLRDRELFFIIGNTWRYRKSFMIVGVFYPPKGTKPLGDITEFLKRS